MRHFGVVAFGLLLLAGVVLAIGVGWFAPSAGAADQAKTDDQAARDREIRDLVASLNNTEVDALQDPESKERAAIGNSRR